MKNNRLTPRLRHRLTCVLIDRKWYVRVDGVQTSHSTIDDAARHLALEIERLEHCLCPHHSPYHGSSKQGAANLRSAHAAA